MLLQPYCIIQKMPKYLLAIPAYNCEKQIERVLVKLIRNEELVNRLGSIIIIDNQSTDLTVKNALKVIATSKYLEKFKVLRNSKNFGLGGSHKVAFLWAKRHQFEYVAILHGDDQASPPELISLIQECELNPELDAILGSRFMSGSRRIGYSKIRTIGNFGLNLIFTIVSGRVTLDLGSGLNIFRTKNLDYEEIIKFPDSLIFNIQLLLYFFSSSAKIKFIPISWFEEDQVSNARNIRIGLGALDLLVKWRLNQKIINTSANESTYLTNEISD